MLALLINVNEAAKKRRRRLPTKKHALKINAKRTKINRHRIRIAQKTHHQALRRMRAHHKRITKLHNHLARHGHKMKHPQYNALVRKYAKYVRSYNRNRKTMCAKLPPLWALVGHRGMPPRPRKCRKWYWVGRRTGYLVAKAYRYLGLHRKQSKKLNNLIRCIPRNISRIRGPMRKKRPVYRYLNHKRHCYRRGYWHQIKASMAAYARGKHPRLRRRRSNNRRKRALRRIIKVAKQVKK